MNNKEKRNAFDDGKEKLKKAGKTDNAEQKRALYEEAFIFLSEAIVIEPKNHKCFSKRGQTFLGLNEFAKALYDFSFAISLILSEKEPEESHLINERNELKVENYACAGQCHFELSQYQEAQAHFKLALSLQKDNGKNLFSLALAQSKLHEEDNDDQHLTEANDNFENAFQLLQGSADSKYLIRFNQGINLRKLGKYDDSGEKLRAAKELKSGNASVNNNLGLTYVEMGDWTEAVSYFEKATTTGEGYSVPAYWNNLGLANYNNVPPNFQKALQDFTEAKKQNMIQNQIPDGTIAFNMGNVYLAIKKFDLAIENFDEAISVNANNPKYWLHKGIVFESMIANIEFDTGPQLIKMKNEKPEDFNDQALDEVKHCVEDAKECYNYVINNIDDNHQEVRYHLGTILHKTYQFAESLKHYERVSKLRPDDHTVFYKMATVEYDLRQYESCIKNLDTALKIQPGYIDALFQLGMAKKMSKQLEEAESDFKSALKNCPERADIHDGLGQCYHAMQRYEDAMEYLDQALNLQPDDVQFCRNRARCFFDQNNFEASVRDLQHANKLDPKDPQVLYELGLTYYHSKKYKKCLIAFKEALRNHPFPTYEPDIYYHIGLSYCREEKFEKAIYPFTKCIERIPNDISYIHERAKAYQMIEWHKEAVKDFDSVLKRNPKNAHAHFRRAFSLKALKEFKKAVADFEQAQNLDRHNPHMLVNYKQMKDVKCIVLCEPGEEKLFI